MSGPHQEPDAAAVLREIGGHDAHGQDLESYDALTDDGSTSCGSWIHAGIYADGVNQAARRRPGSEQTIVAPEWGWAWPKNIRTLYNRASADPEGRPWSERKRYLWWDEEQGKWTGIGDAPDFPVDKAPGYRPAGDAKGLDAISGDTPFMLEPDGRAWMFVPTGLVDGPLPVHYEPHETLRHNPLGGQQSNPARQQFPRPENVYNPSSPDERVFPYVLTTYRLTEHHTAGGMSRTLPFLSELQPEFFCEVSPALAAERGSSTVAGRRSSPRARRSRRG